MALRTVGVRLTAEIGDYQAKLKQASQSTRDFKAELDKAAQGGKLDRVADQAGVAGLALAGMAAYAVKSAADFDKAMSAVSAATHAPADQINALRAAAIQAGKDTQYSATEAAQGITELSKAGVQTADVLGGGLKGALALAAAGQLSVGEAAETAATAMTQFKLSGQQVPHIADLLAAGAGKAQGSVQDMGMALKQSGLVSAQFGLSIEDTTGVLAEFANAGLIGSDAGTSLKTMLLALANPSKQTRDLMNDLGISFYDAQGKFVGLSGVAQILQTRLAGLTDAQRQQALGQIFGNDAIRSASILYADGAEGVQKWKSAVDSAGYASETAAKLTDNLAGDIERLKGSVETLAIQSGSGANSGLRVLAKALNEIVDQFNGMSPAVSGGLTVLAGVGGVLLLGGAAWVKYRRIVAETQAQLVATGPAGEKAAAGLGRVSSALGKAGAAFAVMEGVEILADQFGMASTNVDRLTASLTEFSNSGKVTGELSDVFGRDLKGLAENAETADAATHGFWGALNDFTSSIPGVHGAVDSLNESLFGLSFNQAKDNMGALDQALTNYMNTTNDARKASDLWNRVLSESTLDTDQLVKLLPNAYKKVGELNAAAMDGESAVGGMGNAVKGASGKLGDLNSALDVGAAAQNKYKTHAEAAAGAARGERAALGALFSELKAQTDPVFALIDAQGKLRSAQDAAAKAIKAHGRNSKEAQAANLDLAKAAIDLQGATSNLSASFNGKLSPSLRQTLKAAGLTQGQIARVEDQFKQAKKAGDAFSKKYAGDVHLTGYDGVKNQLVRLSEYQQALKSGKPFDRITLQGTGGKMKFAEGGWTGPGDTYDVAGVVHADEFVIRKDSRRKIEQARPGLLDAMNRTGEVPPGYATGGQVWPFPATAAGTKVPSQSQVANAVMPPGGGPGPGGGQTYHWILDVVHQAFPGLHATSTFRKNSVTLSGNRSYHAVGRAVDFPPSKALAEWVNAHYFRATRELITPWNSLNIHNGQRHRYTGDVFAQHAGTGRFRGNAHDHWAMARGGVIPEHVVGVGRSGRTYEFGENGPETVIPGYVTGGLVNVAPRAATARAGTRLDTYDAMLAAANAVAQLTAALRENGRTWSMATQRGRDNRSALIAGVRAAQSAAKAKFDETGSVKAANKVYDDYLKKLDASLKAMHVNTKTRKELIKAYSQRPTYDLPAAAPSNSSARVKSVTDYAAAEEALSNAKQAFAWTRPTFAASTETGRAELQQLFGFLSAAEAAAQSQYQESGNAATATRFYNNYLAQLRAILLRSGMSGAQVDKLLKDYGRITLTRNRWGGLYQHAAGGALSEAMVAGAGPTRYAWAEPSTGGELFAPKNGDLQKTRREVSWAVANWWGGQVAWGGQGQSARHLTVQAPIAIHLGVETITRQVQIEVDTALGQVAAAAVYQTA